jgi:NodT family efflux transporter outer membrane factor (OMF) lipoprotein
MMILGPVLARHAGWFALGLLLLTLAGCAGREALGNLSSPATVPFSESGQVLAPNLWWTTFQDPGLNAQMDQAFEGSFVLGSALERLRAAQAVTRRQASDLLPDVNYVSEIGHAFQPGSDTSAYVGGLDASYQVDVWGQIRSRVDAARYRASATHADYHAIALTLTAEIARTWFSLIEARAQLELLENQIATNSTGLELQEARFGLGLIRSADVLRQRQLVEGTLEQSVVVQSQIEVLEHQLAVLLGQMPQQAFFETGSVLPSLPPLPSAGLPSELLQRRPDVRRDYLAFLAADRDLAAAITDQYPRISLTSSVLSAAERPETIFRDWFLSFGGQLIGPLIDGGQRRAEVDRTAAVVRQLFNDYGQTMLLAFRDVEDSLAREKYQLERIKYLEAQVELARQASEQLREQYLIGDTDYLSVLTAITAQQRLQRETLSARLDLILIRISLYLALAGDFEPIPQYMQPDSMQLESSPPEYLQPQILQPQILPPQNLQDPAFQLELSPEIVLDE